VKTISGRKDILIMAKSKKKTRKTTISQKIFFQVAGTAIVILGAVFVVTFFSVREMFVNTLFSLIEATGMSTFSEIKVNKLKAAEKIYQSIKDLPKETQGEVRAIIGELIQSSTQAAKGKL
jgi:hypothetical protein